MIFLTGTTVIARDMTTVKQCHFLVRECHIKIGATSLPGMLYASILGMDEPIYQLFKRFIKLCEDMSSSENVASI